MSPTVLRQDGFAFAIYGNDHPPAHVHVKRAENDARIRLEPVEVLHNEGFNDRELSRILSIVRDNLGLFLARWNSFHPEAK
jgi:hypothetical protein